MPVESLQIANFSFGLDTRRSVLTSQLGTLLIGQDGHINQGAEFEKRKAFVALGGAALPTGCFGLEISSIGITTFGSIATPSAFSSTFSGLVNYQRLQAPTGNAMSSVVASTSFQGNCWVIAQFNSGAETYAFYNGVLIRDFTDGLILSSLTTNALIAAAVVAAINRTTSTTGYSAVQDVSPTSALDITGPVGVTYTVTDVLSGSNAGSGTINIDQVNNGTPQILGVSASGQFQIVGGSTGSSNKITSIKVGAVVDGTHGVELLNASVAWGTSNQATAVAVAVAINSFTGTSNYTAQAQGSVITIFATVASGAGSNGFIVQVTAAGNVCIGNCFFSFAGVASTLAVTSILLGGVVIGGGSPLGPSSASPPSFADLASIVAAGVNAQTSSTKVLAFTPLDSAGNPQNTVYISKTITRSDDVPLTLTVNLSGTTGGGSIISGNTVPLTATVSNTQVSNVLQVTTNNAQTLQAQAQVFPAGGTGSGYTYQWNQVAVVTQGTQNETMHLIVGNAAVAVFQYRYNINVQINEDFSVAVYTYNCTITDSGGNVTVSPTVEVIIGASTLPFIIG